MCIAKPHSAMTCASGDRIQDCRPHTQRPNQSTSKCEFYASNIILKSREYAFWVYFIFISKCLLQIKQTHFDSITVSGGALYELRNRGADFRTMTTSEDSDRTVYMHSLNYTNILVTRANWTVAVVIFFLYVFCPHLFRRSILDNTDNTFFHENKFRVEILWKFNPQPSYLRLKSSRNGFLPDA